MPVLLETASDVVEVTPASDLAVEGQPDAAPQAIASVSDLLSRLQPEVPVPAPVYPTRRSAVLGELLTAAGIGGRHSYDPQTTIQAQDELSPPAKVRQRLIALGYSESSVETVPNGLNLKDITTYAETRNQEAQPIVKSQAVLALKGLRAVIDAANSKVSRVISPVNSDTEGSTSVFPSPQEASTHDDSTPVAPEIGQAARMMPRPGMPTWEEAEHAARDAWLAKGNQESPDVAINMFAPAEPSAVVRPGDKPHSEQ